MLKNFGDYKFDFGRTIGYSPALKKLTGSTNSSIFLCQLLYWTNKTTDGWIWKTSDEIEEETGLTYYEQKTARKTLSDLGLIQQQYRRSTHFIYFRVDHDKLYKMWESLSGKKLEKRVFKENPQQQEELPLTPADQSGEERTPTSLSGSDVRRTDAVKKGDWIDAMLDFDKSHMGEVVKKRLEIKGKLEKRLHINASNKKWENFIVFASNREVKYGESADTFISWAIKEGFNPVYWTPEKMQTLYPQAFIKTDRVEELGTFIEKLPERKKEEDYAPMPRSLRRNQNK